MANKEEYNAAEHCLDEEMRGQIRIEGCCPLYSLVNTETFIEYVRNQRDGVKQQISNEQINVIANGCPYDCDNKRILANANDLYTTMQRLIISKDAFVLGQKLSHEPTKLEISKHYIGIDEEHSPDNKKFRIAFDRHSGEKIINPDIIFEEMGRMPLEDIQSYEDVRRKMSS